MNKPLLSVCLITYNHVKYIKQAIEGVLMQKTSFDFEFIIADDCSTDGTTEIVKKYAASNPRLIRTILQESNVGAAINYVNLLEAATGKYIAYFEGDDYWIDNTKIEKQVKFLEANPDYSLCFHNVYILENGKRKKSLQFEIPDTSDINYLLSHPGYITSLSIVYRNSLNIIPMIKELINCPFGDFITYVAVAQTGLIKYFSERMGVYRRHSTGTWSTLGMKKIFENTLVAYRMLYRQLPPIQGEMLKMRYLHTIENYFLQNEFVYDDEEFNKLLIEEMKIEPYVLNFLKQNCEERKKVFHYTSRVPFSILLKSLQEKLYSKIFS
ncbi:MAG: glycosyltransferase [Ferruginibacter sp.]